MRFLYSLPCWFLLLTLSSFADASAPTMAEACPYGVGAGSEIMRFTPHTSAGACATALAKESNPGWCEYVESNNRYYVWVSSQCGRPSTGACPAETVCYDPDPVPGCPAGQVCEPTCRTGTTLTGSLTGGFSCQGPAPDPGTPDPNDPPYGCISTDPDCDPPPTDPTDPGDGGGSCEDSGTCGGDPGTGGGDTGGGNSGGGDTGGGDTGGGGTGGGDTGGGDAGGGDTGGGDTGGGDTGGGDTGGGDTGGETIPGSCPIGSSKNPVTGICEPDDCQPGYYMTSLGCQAIPETPPPPESGEVPEVDVSGIIAAINEQTQQLRTDNQAQTTNIANAEKAAADQITKAINDGVGEITGAIGDIPGGGGGGSLPGEGEGEEEGGGTCDPEEPDYLQCLQKTSLPGVITDGGSFGGSGQSFYDRVSNAPLVKMGEDFADIFNVNRADCPTFAIDLPWPINQTVSTTLHCQLMNQISGIISAVMLIIYAFYGIRIIMSS